jgi:hypothetical protein
MAHLRSIARASLNDKPTWFAHEFRASTTNTETSMTGASSPCFIGVIVSDVCVTEIAYRLQPFRLAHVTRRLDSCLQTRARLLGMLFPEYLVMAGVRLFGKRKVP